MAENKLCLFGDKCKKGSECKFIHQNQGEQVKQSNASLHPNKKRCANGNKCTRRPNCWFYHPPDELIEKDTKSEDYLNFKKYYLQEWNVNMFFVIGGNGSHAGALAIYHHVSNQN